LFQPRALRAAFLAKCAVGAALLAALASPAPARAQGSYTNFSVTVYFLMREIKANVANMAQFSNQWANVEKQLKVDKVYLETTRDSQAAEAAEIETMKQFFLARGIKASGAMGLTANERNNYQTYDYSSQADRDRVKSWAEFTARHFDEIILDDVYFTNDKGDDAIAAKGSKSWTQFRMELLDEVSRNIIIGPAKSVNPKVHIIIKYPNWYESFQGLGYDLEVQPKIFDAIYTGTETRNGEVGQRLQSYQSYLETDYLNHIKPGGNQGGWIDGGGDARYAEQFWDTLFAKVPELLLFDSRQIMEKWGQRGGDVGNEDTNSVLANIRAPVPQPDGASYTPDMVARTAGYSAELMDRFLGKLGKPVGVATYKPRNSVGEMYLPTYLGMVGVPIDLVPDFPNSASTVLLTAASKCDPDLVTKTKAFVRRGGTAIATTGLIEALGDKGFQDIAEIEVTGHRVLATGFGGGRRGGAGAAGAAAPASAGMLLPQMRHFENDTWTSMEFSTAASGYPMLVRAAYGAGTFYVLALPDDFADIYRLPQSLLTQIRTLLGRDLFVSIDAPDHVSLFVYDNRTFIVQNFQNKAVTTRVTARATALRDLLSGKTIASSGGAARAGRGGGGGGGGLQQSPDLETQVAVAEQIQADIRDRQAQLQALQTQMKAMNEQFRAKIENSQAELELLVAKLELKQAQIRETQAQLARQTLEEARGGRGGRGGTGGGGAGNSFDVPVAAHSFRVFAAE
jgi:hypothetical protein